MVGWVYQITDWKKKKKKTEKKHCSATDMTGVLNYR